MGCPGGHEHDILDPIYSLSIYARFSGQFFLKFSYKKIVIRKKIVVPCLDVTMIAFFPKNIQRSSIFARKAHVNTEQVPPGHPVILVTVKPGEAYPPTIH